MKQLAFGILMTASLSIAPGPTAIAQAPLEPVVVHGHWMLEVLNRDGSLAERREFENSLNEGAKALAQVLARQRSVGKWGIRISAASS